jgi:glycosyltransferase involved in cell wall biosynthesis
MYKTKKIGIDARFLGDAGPGRYVKNIIEHLEEIDKRNIYYIFLKKKGYELYTPKNENFKKVLADYTWYSFEEQISFLTAILKYSPDLFYVPHFNIPVLYPKKLVTAIPDLIMHTYSTERGTTLPRWYFRIKKIVYKIVVLWAVLRSKRIIVPSREIINDFKKVFPYINDKKYVLAYEGVDPDFVKDSINVSIEDLGIDKPFLLYISSMYEHKNVPRMLDAFNILKEKYGYTGKLVIIGKKDKFSENIKNKVKEIDIESSVIMPGEEKFVTDEQVSILRKQADAYVFPSLSEGFSLTPLEAQQKGLACVISDIPVHREIYGDSVIYFDPKDPEHIALKIDTVLKSPKLKQDLIQKGFETVKKYNWDDTAKITLDVFKEVLGIDAD